MRFDLSSAFGLATFIILVIFAGLLFGWVLEMAMTPGIFE